MTFGSLFEWGCDVICGGFPCKQTSNAAAVHGYRSGLDGKDSGLWFEMLRVVRLVRPAWVVVENVAGAATYATEIRSGLETAGFRLPDEPLCLSAQDFGAPHRRRRLFWIANSSQQRPPESWQSESPETARLKGTNLHGSPWVQALPAVLRVDDGVPARLDRCVRIESLGNAVVPAIAEYIGKRIIDANQRVRV